MSVRMPELDAEILGRRDRIVTALRSIVPGEGVIAGEREMRPYETDGLTAYRQLPMVVVLPETTQQVAEVLRYCHDEGIKVVPRGAGTSLSGGALPLGDGVLLGMAKFNRIREIDFENRVAVVEPGVTNLAVTNAVAHVGGSLAVQTSFTLTQLLDPQVASSEKILRACVHCGFCTATCPTYVLLGDELDSPRGRIYLIKEMLEQDKPPTRDVVKHIDRCLSCLACMTTCPSGVHYMHLVDHARERIEKSYKRPLTERAVRAMLARVLTDPALFRLAVVAGLVARPLAPVLDLLGLRRVAAMLKLTPHRKPAPPVERTGKVYPAEGKRRGRVALLSGCINPVLAPSTDEAAIRLLNRHGIEVVVAAGEGCCGSLVHHMGREDQALAQARNNVDAWTREIEGDGLDAILVTVSGCGTTVKDYGFMRAFFGTVTAPPPKGQTPASARNKVDLPAPDGPLTSTRSPSLIVTSSALMSGTPLGS